MSKPSILFMGTPEFAQVSLSSLWEAGYPISGVFTQPDKPAGRGQRLHASPCALFALEKKLPLFQPKKIKDDQVIGQIAQLKPEFIVVVAYGKLLPQKILDIPHYDSLNVHASLLPKYRGAAPINWALINSEEETGVTVMKMVQKMDAGPIYSTEKLKIDSHDTAGILTKKLAKLGARLLLHTLPLIQEGKIDSQVQEEEEATLAPLLTKEEGKAQAIYNRIRGLNPWPSAYTFIDKKMLKIYDSEVLSESPKVPPGTIYLVSQKDFR